MTVVPSPLPNLAPYFVPEGRAPKDGAKWGGPGEENVRLDLLPTEAMFRVAGAIGMVLGAAVFVIFAVPVSGMLRVAGEPGGVLLDEDWKWRRWVARMATVLTLAVVAAATSWGLGRRRPWARWALILLGAVPPLALAVGLGLRPQGDEPAVRELGDVMTMPCVGVIVFPASALAFWAACSRRGRLVFGPQYDELSARTPKLSPAWKTGLPTGATLALTMFILYWTVLLIFLCTLAACGVIRST